MSLIVQKFGGSSVRDAQRIQNVARIIAETYMKGNDVIVVLSAQGDTTDDLLAKAAEINPHASKRELDMLLATGEQISVALCAMALEAMGLPCVSLAALWTAVDWMPTCHAVRDTQGRPMASSAIAHRATDTCSPVDKSTSISRCEALGLISLAFSIKSSVVSP